MSNKTMKATAAILFAAALAVAGCGGSSSSSSKADTGGGSSTSGGSTSGGSGGSGGSCGKYTDGKDGVIRTFCDGSGSAKVTVDGKEYAIKGITCQKEGSELSIQAGVVVGADFTGAKPDYIGLIIPAKGGDFTNATASVTFGGKGYALTENSGTGNDQSGTFKGTAYGDNNAVTGSWTC